MLKEIFVTSKELLLFPSGYEQLWHYLWLEDISEKNVCTSPKNSWKSYTVLLLHSFSNQKGIIHDEQFACSISWYPYKEFFMNCKKFKDNSKVMPKVPIKEKDNS